MDADGLTPTAETVLVLVRECGPLSRQELLDRLDRHEQTVDSAISQLREQEILSQTRKNDDLRQVVVYYSPDS